MGYEISYSCVSHIGNVRIMNQDNFLCDGLYMSNPESEIEFPLNGRITCDKAVLFGVFDGMGGEECGEIASYIAAEKASKIDLKQAGVPALSEYCKQANKNICEYARDNGIFAMGTTVAMLLFSKKIITLCNIGDSKVFLFSDGELEQISKDHVAISAFGTKPPLSQNLGIPPELLVIEPYLSQGKCKRGDKYLICSDGLTDMMNLEEITEVLNRHCVEDGAMKLVQKALENGGRDNITVILLEIKKAKYKFFNVFNTSKGEIKS